MKYDWIALTIGFVLSIVSVNAQVIDTIRVSTPDSLSLHKEEPPEFPGGIEKFASYFFKNLHCPNISPADNISGRFVIEMIIEKNGEVVDAKVVKGGPLVLNQELIRVCLHSPKWKPAIKNGEPVRFKYTFPISCLYPGFD